MKRIRKFLLTVGVAAALMGLTAGVAAAVSNQVVKGHTGHSIYKVGRSITITGTVDGDVICAGQTITINAEINGDVVCAGQTITVNGLVHGDVRVAAQTANIGAQVERNATFAAQDATLQSSASVGGDVGIASQTATIDSPVGRDVRGSAQTLSLQNKVGRNVDANVNKLVIGKGTVVGGNLDYKGPRELAGTNGAVVNGKLTYHHEEKKHRSLSRFSVAWNIYVLLAMLTLSMVIVAWFPQLLARFNKQTSQRRLWVTLLTGVGAMFAVPAIFIGLLVSAVGLPLAIMLALFWLMAIILSAPITAFYLGSRILRNEHRAPLIMLVGGLTLGLLSMVPIIGGFAVVLGIWFGTGSLLLNIKKSYPKPNYKV